MVKYTLPSDIGVVEIVDEDEFAENALSLSVRLVRKCVGSATSSVDYKRSIDDAVMIIVR